MKADPAAQLRLLDLQAVDTAVAQLTHRRRTLPELALLQDLQARAGELAIAGGDLQARVDDVSAELARLEKDVELVRARRGRDESRLAAGGLPSRELEGLQHEVATLQRRQATLEDELLEVMEQRETLEVEDVQLAERRSELDTRRSAAEASRDAALSEIDAALADRAGQRERVAAELPADLLALYERVRAQQGGVGAAALRQRRCEGCRIELSGNDLSAARTGGAGRRAAVRQLPADPGSDGRVRAVSGGSVVVEADGGSRGNPGPAGYGAVVRDAASAEVLAERKDAIGVETNNVAEYRGLLAGLEAAAELGADDVLVRMDSKLVVEQMNGRWQVKHPALRPLARQAAQLASRFGAIRFEWIPREENRHADRLANEAMDAAAGRPSRRAHPGPAAAPAAAPAPAGAPVSWGPPTGTATTLVLVRHGSTQHSAARRFSGRNDLPLDEAGRAQAAALGATLSARVRAGALRAPDAVVASPLPRARETAAPIADVLGLPVEVEDGFAETDFGEWEGSTFAEAQQRDPDALTRWLGGTDVAPPGGESFAAVTRRVRRARDAVISAHPGQCVVVVSHVTPIKVVLQLALDAPPTALFRLHLDTASISRVDLYADGNASVRLVNDTCHLS